VIAAPLEPGSEAPYQAVLERLHGRGRFGVRLGLTRIRALLRGLGNPERGLRGVLVGGTNGKGSVQALVAAALSQAGYLTGQMPSPHLGSYRERITVGGQPISREEFTDLLTEVLDVAEKIARRVGPATEFEALTAAAFLHFARAGVQVGVIEVGMGGRLDATNAWQGGVSAITNVALDHMEYLGSTVAAIATEKSHIIKRGDAAALTGAQGVALGVITARAHRVHVPLAEVEAWPVSALEPQGMQLRAPDGAALRIGLLGRHQAANVALAAAIVSALGDAGIARVGAAQLAAGLESARWSGRLELLHLPGRPPILLDGAHNPSGVAALGAALRELLPQFRGGHPTLLIGMLANHWQPEMLEPLATAMPGATIVATRVPGATNSLEPARLAAEWGAGAATLGDPDQALDSALEVASRAGGLLVVCGSLYLVGHVRGRLMAGSLTD
jgi:dihydrofolate synthase / folylpolyglutamate synthase